MGVLPWLFCLICCLCFICFTRRLCFALLSTGSSRPRRAHAKLAACKRARVQTVCAVDCLHCTQSALHTVYTVCEARKVAHLPLGDLPLATCRRRRSTRRADELKWRNGQQLIGRLMDLPLFQALFKRRELARNKTTRPLTHFPTRKIPHHSNSNVNTAIMDASLRPIQITARCPISQRSSWTAICSARSRGRAPVCGASTTWATIWAIIWEIVWMEITTTIIIIIWKQCRREWWQQAESARCCSPAACWPRSCSRSFWPRRPIAECTRADCSPQCPARRRPRSSSLATVTTPPRSTSWSGPTSS